MLFVWNCVNFVVLNVFGFVLSVILVLVLSGKSVCMLDSIWLRLVVDSRFGVLLLMNMVCICWFYMSGSVCLRLVCNVLRYLVFGNCLFFYLCELKL